MTVHECFKNITIKIFKRRPDCGVKVFFYFDKARYKSCSCVKFILSRFKPGYLPAVYFFAKEAVSKISLDVNIEIA